MHLPNFTYGDLKKPVYYIALASENDTYQKYAIGTTKPNAFGTYQLRFCKDHNEAMIFTTLQSAENNAKALLKDINNSCQSAIHCFDELPTEYQYEEIELYVVIYEVRNCSSLLTNVVKKVNRS